MRPRQPVRWLMTDERMGATLWSALRALPPGSGIVFRHHATPPGERRRLLRRVGRIATARRLMLLVAGDGVGRYPTHGGGSRPASWPAHDRREAIAGVRAGARRVFVSPVYPTRSHPGAPTLGPMAAAGIAARARHAAVATRPLAANPAGTGAALPNGSASRSAGRDRARDRITVIALGGMDERRWRRIARLGFDGWAAIDAWLGSADQKRKIVPT